MFVGIDFGTSNSSIGVYHDDQLRLFNLDPHHHNPNVLPSTIYVTKEQEIFVGAQAIQMYLEQETGRIPFWETREMGDIEITVGGPGSGPIVYNQRITMEVDTAANGRLLQSIKTALFDDQYQGTQIFDKYYTIEELIAILLTQLRERCENVLGQPVHDVVMGRPVKFSDNPDIDKKSQEKLHNAALMAGFNNIVFELEPIGGAYLYHQNQPTRQHILVFDFGGGTLDMTIMEVGASTKPKTIATEGVIIGGDDLTAAIMKRLFRFFGEDAVMSDGLPFPKQIFDMLYSWQNMVELSRPKHAYIFRQAMKGSDPYGAQRLETLIKNKLGFKLFQELERVKIDLSNNYFSRLIFKESHLSLSDVIMRTHFESLIQDELDMVDKSIQEILRKSGLHADQIHAVLRTGGSSEIPVFIDVLAKYFGHDRIKEINPFTTIVGGLALKGHELNTMCD